MKSPLLQPLNAHIQTRSGLTRWVASLAILAFLVSFSQAELQAQNYVVNSSSDANSGSGLTGTLRYCITQANAAPGAGLRTITFTVPFVDFNTDYPQIVKPMLIDGGPSKVIIKDPTPGDATVRPFFLNAGSSGSTIRNLEVRGGGYEPIRIDGSPTNITIRNFSCNNIGGVGNNWNYGIFINGNASGYVIDNVQLRDIQTNYDAIWIEGTATNLTIDSLKIPDGLYGDSKGIHVGGVATNVSITNTYIDGEDQSIGGDEGDYIIYFASNVNGLTMTNDTFLDPGYAALRVRGTLTNFNISNSRIINTYGHHGAVGIWADGTVNGFTVNNVFMDMDVTTEHPTNNGDYGIYVTANVTNLNIDNLTVRDADVRSIYIAGVTTTASIINSSFDKKLSGLGAYEMLRFNGAVSGLTMTNVDINADVPGAPGDSDYGIYIDGAVSGSAFNDVWINEADLNGIHIPGAITTTTFTNVRVHNSGGQGINFGSTVNTTTLTNVLVYNSGGQGINFDNTVRNTTITGSRVIKSGARGIYFAGGGSVFMNVDIVNTRIDSSGTAGVEAYVFGAGANADLDFTGDTITYSGEDGILVRWPNGDSDVTVTACVLAHNGRTSALGDGIQVQNLSKVMIIQNSIYDNAGQGINLNGTGNCSLDPHDPVINTIINNGGGSYTVNFTIPAGAAAAGGTFTLEFFTNDAFSGAEGQHFAHTASGYAVGTHNITFTTVTGPAADPKLASLSMTYTRVGSACYGTSEFSNSLGLDPQGPGCVDLGIRGWYRADKFFNNYTTGQVVSLWPDNSGNGNLSKQWVPAEQPKYFAGDATTNFNPSITFDNDKDNLEILQGLLSPTLGATILTAAYVKDQTGNYDNIYNQAADNPALARNNNTNGELLIWDASAYAVAYPAMRFYTNTSSIFGMDYGTTTNSANGLYNGLMTANVPQAPSPLAGVGYIGGQDVGETWNGKIHELILYNRELNATERQKINTYLSIKWGASMDTTIMKVPGTGNDYITGDGSVIWTANNKYYHRITGIGRDDCDSLVQKQSRNVNLTSPGYVTIGLGTIAATNAANVNTIAADKNFMVWGDDGKAGSGTTTITGDGVTTLMGGTCSQYSRLAKTFRVQETGTIGAVQLQFNMTGVKLGKTVDDYYLAIHSSDVFSGTIDQLVAPASYDNVTGILVFDNVNFASNAVRYFTIVGKRVYGPANITANLALWLKAEDGIAGNDGDPLDIWGDQGPAANDALQSTAAKQPLYKKTTNLINFNPAVDFDGADDDFTLTSSILKASTTYNNLNIFAVSLDKVASQNAYFLWQTTASGRFSTVSRWSNAYTYFETPAIDQFYSNSSPLTINKPDIWQFTNEPGATGVAIKRSNINLTLNSTTGTSNTGANNPFYIGSRASNFWNGRMGEVIFYTGALMPVERQKIASYLALKWGITLDQATAYNYIASDGTVVWDATVANLLYKNRITGIGRDDCSDLIQRQSRNQDTTSAFVTIGLGAIAATNIANLNNFTADKSFLIWGDDNVAGANATAVTGDGTITLTSNGCGVFRRLGKTFKVQETGTVGNVQVTVNLRGVTLGKVATDFYLAINSTSTFSGTITKLVQATSYNAGILTFNNVDFASGQFFTVIGLKAQGPANITSNLKLWLRAEEDEVTLNGSTISGWTDQGPAGNDAIQGTAANQPTYSSSANLINFHPTVSFNGSNNWMRTGSNIYGTGNISYTTFGIVNHNSVAGNNYYFADGPVAGSQAAWFGHQGALQAQANWANDLAAGPVAINVPYLEGFTRDGTTNTKTNYQSAKLMGSNTLGAINKTNNGWGEIGANTVNTELFNGKVGEIISFQSVLTALEQQKVYSYLAVKWGFTLDQTTPYDYLSANGSVIYNATTYAVYKNRITGIGRDDCSDLIQKQSKSVETGALVTVSNGSSLAVTNNTNPSSFGVDNSWMLFGDNNKGLTWTGSGVPVNGGNVRLNRVWRVAETGTVGVVYLEVPDNTSALTTKLPPTTNSIYLLVANSGTNGKFSALSGVTVQQMTFDATNKKWYTTYNFADGDYFTFGSEKTCIAPAGISEGLTTWYHATDLAVGTVATPLADLAFGVHPLTKAGTANVVAGSATSFNYNRSMTLTAGSFSKGTLSNTDVLDATAGSMFAVGSTNANLFAISSTALNSSGLLNPSAQFNGTAGTYGAGVASTPNIFTMIGSTANVKGYTNGTAGTTSGSIGARAVGAYTLGLGKNGSNAGSYTGSIAEAFTFDRALDPEEKDVLESYLAIKYGQTLSHNYYNGDYDGSNGATTTVYNVSTYANRVFGVGTDTTGCFYQKQSTSVLTGSMLKMSINSSFAAENSGNTASFTQDRSYVMAGDDGGSILAWVAGGGANPNTPAIYETTCETPVRINRQWKVTGTYVTPSILFAIPDATSSDATRLPAVTAGYSVWMIVNDNSDFGVNGFQSEIAMTLNGTTLNWEAQYQVPAGATKYITFVMKNNAISTGAVAPTIVIAETDNSCTVDDGKVLSGAAAILTPTSGASYLWNTGPATPTLMVSPTMNTTYTVTVTAANGCTGTASSTITIVTAPTAAIAETDNSCTVDDSQVLSGDPATLSASGGNSYSWNDNSTSAALTVSPTMTTTYTVTVSNADGCTNSATATITIVTAPSVSLVGSDSICIGDMSGVSPTSGGTWASSDPAVATVTNAGVVTGISAGTVTFNFTATGTGCASASTPAVTVNPTPAVSIIGANSICVGFTTTLSPNFGGTWISNSPSVATVDAMTGVVTGVTAGTATFTFTNSTTGCISAPTPAVTVNALPVVSVIGMSTICVGATTTLTPAVGGTWVSSNPTIASVTNTGVVSGLSGGTVTFTFTKTAAPNCSATTATVTINALPVVSIAGLTTICAGQTTNLLPASGGAWTSSNTAVATVTNAGVVTGVSAGSATFTFTDTATGCTATTSPVTVDALAVVSITGVNSICTGFTTTLSPTTGGTWVSNNPSVATVTDGGVVTGVGAGTATFTFTNTSTGCVSMPTAAVSVTDLPTISITGANTICVGITTTLSPTSGGTWVSSDPSVATVTNSGLVTGVSAGSVTFTFTSAVAPNCASTTAGVTILALPVASITGTSTICAGSTTTLSPTTGGSWVSSNPAVATVTNAGVVTGLSAGSATFTFTLTSTGCVSLPTSAVTVNALPVVSISGSTSVCVGFTTTLLPASGGAWASSDPTVATVSNTGVVTGVSVGTATFTFTNSVTGCVSAPTPAVTVNLIPSVNITGLTSICIGAMSGVSPTTGGTWTSSNPAVATVDNAGVITGVSAGTATFTFTSTATGCTSLPTPAITVNAPTPVSITGPTSVCIGFTTTLSPTNGIWMSSDPSVATVTNAGLVTGVSAGTATFIFTNAITGCQSPPSAAITVNAPIATSILGSSSICVGFTTTLSPSSGGTWMSSDPTVATVSNTGVVTGVSAGTANFTFTNTSTGCVSAPTAAITVNALPTVSISGPNNICVGATTGLSPSSGGTWVSSNPLVATVTDAGVVTGVAAGTANFTFTNTTTGCVSLPTATVTVNPTPAVSIVGGSNICIGFTTTLSPIAGGTWVSTNPAVATVSNAGVVTGVSAGSATFIFSNSTTGCVSAATAPVTVEATPIVSIIGATNLCIGASSGLSPATGGTWVSSNASVATVTNAGVVTAVAPGTATFTFTNTSTGCASAPTAAITVNGTPAGTITGTSTICVGATTTLSPTTGGTWTSSNAAIATVTNAGLVTGISAGSATFTFTNALTGCIALPTAPVTVNALPVVSITGGSNICVGGSSAVSPTTGGMWSSSNPAIATVTNAGVVTGLAAGSVTFTFVHGVSGCSAVTLPVTINALPVASITGATSICVTATTTLSPSTGGTWASSNSGVASVTNAGVVTGVSAGTATFTFTSSTSGCVSVATAAVTVNAIPVVSITGSASICTGSTTTLSPVSGGTWISSNPAVASVTNGGVVTAVSPGTATFTFTNTTTGCVSPATSPVTVNALPVASVTGTSNICVGSTTTLSPTTGGTWASSNPAVASVTNAGVVNGLSAGSVTFIFTNSLTGCPSASTSAVTVSASPIVSITGINNICIGSTTTLSPTTGGTWASSNPSVASVTNGGVVLGIAAGTVTFSFTSTSTGCTSAPTAAVTVNGLPAVAIAGSNNICVGGTSTLTPTTGGTWASSNPAVATVTNGGVVTAVGAGTVTFTFTSSSTGCASAPTGVLAVTACNSLAAVKVLLSGPYDESLDLMGDNLRVGALIPNAQPYGGSQYGDFNYNGSETIGMGVLGTTGANAIVDWVLVELRSAVSPGAVLARKAALVQRDGDVVESADGVSPVVFVGATAGNYYVAVKHRNHLGVMTAAPIALSGSVAVSVNFTSASTNNYQLPGSTGSAYAQKTLPNGKRALWDGNMSFAGGTGNQLRYQGSNSDSDEPYFKVLLDPGNVMVIPNYVVNAYDRSDGNMDGLIIYQGGGSDADLPFFNIGDFPDNSLSLPNFVIFEQIP